MFQDLLNEWIKYWENKYREKVDMSQMVNAINFASWLDTRSPTLRAAADAGGGWTCIRCKTANSDDKSICGFCDTPRLGG